MGEYFISILSDCFQYNSTKIYTPKAQKYTIQPTMA